MQRDPALSLIQWNELCLKSDYGKRNKRCKLHRFILKENSRFARLEHIAPQVYEMRNFMYMYICVVRSMSEKLAGTFLTIPSNKMLLTCYSTSHAIENVQLFSRGKKGKEKKKLWKRKVCFGNEDRVDRTTVRRGTKSSQPSCGSRGSKRIAGGWFWLAKPSCWAFSRDACGLQCARA